MSVHYDALDINRDIVLDLPFREGVGAITHSVAKTKPLVTIVGAPAPWSILDSGLPFLTLNGTTEYLWASAADTTLLDFTSQDYSIGGWFRIDSGGPDNPTLLSRFLLSTDGWELYHYTTLTLQMRHHHASQVGNERTSCYSENWAFGTWYFMGFSRTGATAQFYRGDANGLVALPMFYSLGGLVDPDACNRNLLIGTDPTFVNDYKGGLWRPRAWRARALTFNDWQYVWERELRWFLS